jgi:hypothetical protein
MEVVITINLSLGFNMSKYCDVGTKNQVGTQEVEAILIVLVY